MIKKTTSKQVNINMKNEVLSFQTSLKSQTDAPPEFLSDVVVGLVAAVTRRQVVITQDIVLASTLTLSQDAVVNFEHTLVQQLVQNGCGTKETVVSEESKAKVILVKVLFKEKGHSTVMFVK